MNKNQITYGYLHYTILKFILDNGFAPELNELSEILGLSETEVRLALMKLQDNHGVVLHPDTTKIWVIHPFSLAPTNFSVKSNGMAWWGNCAWCSLGIATLLKQDCIITTTLGADAQQVHLHIQNGEIIENDYYIHFPIPMMKAWDNVTYTCSTMLLFKEKIDIEIWSKQYRINQGDIQPLRNVWEFAQVWYGNHLNPQWEKWTNRQAQDIFNQFSLHHSVWNLPQSDTIF